MLSGMSGAKTIQSPKILRFVVTQHVVIAVIGENAKIARLRGVPPAIEFSDYVLVAIEDETERTLVGAVPRIAFDANFAHRASAGRKGLHRRRTSANAHSLAVLTACAIARRPETYGTITLNLVFAEAASRASRASAL